MATVHGSHDDPRGSSRFVVLPEAKHLPTAGLQECIGVSVASNVCLDLVSPPMSIRLWPGSVFSATVPKAAVNKDRDACLGEDHVGLTAKTAKRSEMNPETQPAAVKLRAQLPLRRSIP